MWKWMSCTGSSLFTFIALMVAEPSATARLMAHARWITTEFQRRHAETFEFADTLGQFCLQSENLRAA